MKTANQLAKEISSAPRNARGHRVFTKPLRIGVAQYGVEQQRLGVSVAETAKRLHLSESLLVRWQKSYASEPAAMVAVEVVSTSRSFTLKGPGGFHIDGLSADDVAALMKASNAR